MLSDIWLIQLGTILKSADKRLAILGVGNELKGDDAVGIYIIRELQTVLAWDDKRLLLEAGIAPENLTGQLRRFAPHTVLLIDAVDMGQPSGMIQYINLEDKIIESVSSTHSISLCLFAIYIKAEFNCDVHLMGIQAEQTILDTPLSASVQSTAERVVNAFLTLLNFSSNHLLQS